MENIKTEPAPRNERLERAEKKVRFYSLLGIPAGLLPLPALDLALIGGLQLKMVHELTKIYETPFKKSVVKSVITALVSASTSMPTARLAASALKIVPALGAWSGAIAMSSTSSALTYAVGKVFITHFESGETVLTLNPKKMHQFFQEKYQEAKAEENPLTFSGIKP